MSDSPTDRERPSTLAIFGGGVDDEEAEDTEQHCAGCNAAVRMAQTPHSGREYCPDCGAIQGGKSPVETEPWQ